MSNMLNNAIAVNCMHSSHRPVDILLYNMELGEAFTGGRAPDDRPWFRMNDPSWQGVRETRIMNAKDLGPETTPPTVFFRMLVR